MKILLAHHDKYRWVSQVRAEEFKKVWKNDDVDIAYYRSLPAGEGYDVIHFLFSGGLTKVKDYIVRHKDKTFTTLASQRTLDEYYDKLPDLIEIYQNTVCCVCQNPVLLNKYRQLVQKDNAVYIPNGVDEHLFDRKFIVGFVGAIPDATDHKGYKLIKQACDELGLDLKMAHNGHEYDIHPHETMPNFYESVDCLVLASLSEGCNNPTLEALAMNKPVISTDVGIASELEGVTIVDRDIASIKAALRKLSGRIQILENYTWTKIAARYHNLYLEKLKKS